jgi:hypothetical protein
MLLEMSWEETVTVSNKPEHNRIRDANWSLTISLIVLRLTITRSVSAKITCPCWPSAKRLDNKYTYKIIFKRILILIEIDF